MSHPRWMTWLARFVPALLTGRGLHRAAVSALRRGEATLAAHLFARAATRYVEDYDADAAARLRADRRRGRGDLRAPAGA
jgi:hypothetical protein